jgi:diguanylate cyclase (GGDEF)-like protein
MAQFMDASYDPWVVAASFFIAAFASYVTLDLAKRERSDDRFGTLAWWFGGSIVMGTGIWSMHFIGMLAYTLPIQLGYQELLTFLSWVAAVSVSGVALWIAGSESLTLKRLFSGSSAMATGICAMHYTGMAAIDLAPGIIWDGWLVAASAAVALVASAAALQIFFWLRNRDERQLLFQVLAALVMGAAISGMHYTGMAAAGVPEGAVCLSAGAVRGEGLTTLLVLSTSGMLALTLLTSLHSKASRLAKWLQAANGELQKQAFLDPLTGLPNRLLFEDRLQQAIRRQERAAAQALQNRVAIMFIDLDGFKPVNDSFGHLVGDLVLKKAAERLRSAARAMDTVARIGGDEFLLMMEGVGEIADATVLARRVVDCLNVPFDLASDKQVRISASVGIVLFPDHGCADKLVVNADAAMYAAKRAGGSTFAVYGPHMDGDAAGQVALQGELRQALERRELSLHYQPKVDARDGTIVGVEALIRWRHSERGMVAPSSFIPVAERFGMIVTLGNWVVDEACRQMQEWSREGFMTQMAINVSTHQLRQPDFVDRLAGALRRHNVDPSHLLCEITESAAMEDIMATQRTFEGLSRIGVFLSIDDFGTGYSSLSYLRQLPASQLKIDRSFVKDLESSGDARAVVDAVVRLSHALGLRVVAEGVETAAQRTILVGLGCDELQGFHFARPMEARQLVAWVGAYQKGPGEKSKGPRVAELVE